MKQKYNSGFYRKINCLYVNFIFVNNLLYIIYNVMLHIL